MVIVPNVMLVKKMMSDDVVDGDDPDAVHDNVVDGDGAECDVGEQDTVMLMMSTMLLTEATTFSMIYEYLDTQRQ